MELSVAPELSRRVTWSSATAVRSSKIGGDTASRLFGVGNAASLKKIKRDKHFQELATVLHSNQ